MNREEESESIGSEMPHSDYIHVPKSESSVVNEKSEFDEENKNRKKIKAINNINQNLIRKNSKQHIQTPRQFEEKRLQYECYIKSITLKNCQVSLHNFELIKFLGKGASGTVYLVRGHVLYIFIYLYLYRICLVEIDILH